MKKVDKVVIKAFLPPFFLTFFVVLFILFFVFMTRYFEDLVGKDFGVEVYVNLFFYFALSLVPQALPLSVLLSSLMAYGNMGEHFELTAIKSAGISLPRVLVPIGILAVVISGFAFLFNNYVTPEANLKAYSLMYDVRQAKPTFDLKEGGFYADLPTHRIRVEKKRRNSNDIYGVMIYDHSSRRGNTDLIMADTGKIYFVMDNNYMVIELGKGNKFSQHVSNTTNKQEFVRDDFGKAKFVLSLADLMMAQTPEELFKSHRIMKNVSDLRYHSDSLYREVHKVQRSIAESSMPYYDYAFSPARKDVDMSQIDTLPQSLELMRDTINAADLNQLYEKALTRVRNLKSFAYAYKDRNKQYLEEARQFHFEMWSRYALAVACFAMFLIGAPLGAIIKKGGLGVPVLVSIVFFIIFYFLTITCEKYAKEGLLPVILCAWIPNLALFMFGIVFFRQAYQDSRLFDLDAYYVLYYRLKNKYGHLFSRKKIAATPIIVLGICLASCTSESLQGFDQQQWKNDKGGCKDLRKNMLDDFKTVVQPRLEGLSEDKVIRLIGKPDRAELYERNQKFYTYFVEKGEHCQQANTKSAAQHIILRFDAIGNLNEVVYQTR